MAKYKKFKKKNTFKWLLLGIIAALIAAPNNAVSKYALNDMDPVVFMLLRALIISVISFPFIIISIPKINRKNLKYSLLASLFITVATITFVIAIKYGESSFVTVLDLAAPIVLIFLAAKITKEKINHKAIAGVTLAAIGAFIIVFSPIAIAGGLATQFYPISALAMMINVCAFPLYIIYSKKANAAGMPLHANMGIAAVVVTIFGLLWYLIYTPESVEISSSSLMAVAYSGIAVIFIARILDVISYKHLGAAALSTLFYLEIFTALLFSTLWLNEKLALSTLIGGIIIMVGIYVTEHHKSKHFRHFHIHKRH